MPSLKKRAHAPWTHRAPRAAVLALALSTAPIGCGDGANAGTPAGDDVGVGLDAETASDADAIDAIDALDAPTLDAPTPDSSDGAADAGAGLARGVSAWVYSNQAKFADSMIAYDGLVQSAPDAAHRQTRYLFPYAGSVGITGTAFGQHHVGYDAAASAFYAARLPMAKMLPNVDSGDGAKLSLWTAADQEKLAAAVAQPILDDAAAAGVHIDIEPYDDRQLPFYAKLRALLNARDKLVTMFTGRTNGLIYQTADVVVLSGYDLGISPVSTAAYTMALRGMVDRATASAAASGARLMVGIPASASFEEYAAESGTCTANTGFTQEQWVDAALAAVCPHHFDPSYLGLSLWELTDKPLQLQTGCFRHPDGISDATWQKLAAFDPTHCP